MMENQVMTENSGKRFKTFKNILKNLKINAENPIGLLQGHKNHEKMRKLKINKSFESYIYIGK